ncbi:alkaline phosphatase family protein [Halorussus amylolyticus]|uniref:alkaline phosphatase family protein n=1 Tax=Halorussus amylolyticus TaxID=1126242 RepID=UPI00192F8E99|nr:alkaline phosphatase family protein [Halorussus amylolyticus]
MELLVIGLDGLSTNMLDRFGIEPEYISGVLDEGVSGDLVSVDTPTTLPAWTSFATGKDPGSHGLTNMIQQSPDYETTPLKTNTTDAAAYDLIDDAMFVNLPASVAREATAENTHLVSAMLAEDEHDAVPEHLQELDAFDGYLLDHDKALKKRPSVYFDHVCDITRARRDFAKEAFETYDPRFGFVLFSTPDWAGHLLSNFSDDETRGGYYRQLLDVVDECTADLAAMADNVVLMSDHGFERKHTNVHVNDYLRDEGYLREESADLSATQLAVQLAKSVGKRSDFLYERIRQVYNYIIATDVGQSLQEAAEPDIDYPASDAWQIRYGCLYVNDDRFDHPTVENPDALRRQLRDELAGLTDDEGRPLFRDVLLADEAYADPGEWAPDVIARPAQGCYPTMLASPTGGYASHTNNYNHRYRGLFAATGPLFADESSVEASIVDVLPTVMAALELPLSPEFDGEVIRDAFADDVTVAYRDASDVPEPRTRTASESDQAARDDAVEDRLEDLGYLE